MTIRVAVLIAACALLLIAACAALLAATSPVSAEVASRYGREHHGLKTANGERFNMYAMTAASRTFKFGTRLRVCRNGCVVVRINDYGPAKWTGRDIDLSAAAAQAIGITHKVGVGRVSIARVN